MSLDFLQRYFLTGTTEGERNILEECFVYDDSFMGALAPPEGSPRLLIGKKGAGKTALVEYLHGKFEAQGIPSILLRPEDFNLSALGQDSDLGSLKRASYSFLTFSVANRLAQKGKLATGHQAVLEQAANAFKDGDLDAVQSILKFLTPVGKALTSIDFKELLPKQAPNPERVASAIKTQLGSIENVAYLVIDDTDQIGEPNKPNYLPRLWGLLLGARRLASEIPNLKCLITLRTEVWRRLKWDSQGSREHVDHFNPLIVEWVPNDDHIEKIWMRRLELASRNEGNPIDRYFESRSVNIPNTEETRLWSHFLVKSARERPRDLIQLMGKLITEASRTKSTTIKSAHLRNVINEYSSERVEYLAQEFEDDCSVLREIVQSLAKLENIFHSQTIYDHLSSQLSSYSCSIRGKTLRHGSREDVFSLWRLLHEAGVINALIADNRQPRGFRHIGHGDDPTLVTIVNWNRLQGLQWEIHPAFRSYLNTLRDAEAATLGLSATELRRLKKDW